MEAGEHGAEVVRAYGEHGRQSDGGVHRIAAADPVPESKHVVGIDAEFRDLGGVGGNGHEMPGDRFDITAQPLQRPGPRGVAFVNRFPMS